MYSTCSVAAKFVLPSTPYTSLPNLTLLGIRLPSNMYTYSLRLPTDPFWHECLVKRAGGAAQSIAIRGHCSDHCVHDALTSADGLQATGRPILGVDPKL